MTERLRAAAQALVARWDSPQWGGSAEHLRHTGEYIAALRAALAEQPAEQEPAIYPDEAFDMGLEAIPYYTAPQPAIPPGYKLVSAGALQMVVNALRRDAAEGKAVRGEMADELLAVPEAPQPAKRVPHCTWSFSDDDSGTWASACGELWSFIDGGPTDNRVRHCHGCGRPVTIKQGTQ